LAAEKIEFYGSKKYLPESWILSTIGKNANRFEYGSSKKSEKNGKVPVLRMGNIQNGVFDWSDLVYSNDDDEIKKYTLSKYDVLFNRTNSPELVGKTAIYKGERKAIFAGYLIRIQYKDTLDPFYLNYFLNSPYAREYGNSVKTDGVNQSNINAKKLSNYPIPICSQEEQQQIVQEIESRLSLADHMEESIDESLLKAEALRQSILKRAFEGKLLDPMNGK
jgi:type I restriction enzyme S subunit